MAMTVVEELVSVLGLEIGENALSNLTKFRSAVTTGLAGIGGMVAALGAAFAGTVVSTAHWGVEVNKVAQQIGISTDAVQELKYAADATNVSWESMTVGLKFLSKNAAEGADASIRISEALGGVEMRNANGQLKTADELLEAFADKIAAIKDPIEQVKVAMHGMHGQSGVEKMPLLKLGGAGIRKLREEARDLGLVLNKETIDASDRFWKSLNKLKFALMGVRNEVGSPFIDDFTEALDDAAHIVRGTRIWFMELAKTIRDLGQRFGRVIEVGKHAFEVVRKFAMDNKLDKLADAVHWVELLEAAMVGIAVIGVASAGSVAASWLLAAAPFLLIATLIGLIVDDIAHFLTGGESVLGMADKWSRAFDPKDSNLIKLLKAALSFLFDLGDPAKWRRVVEAVKAVGGDVRKAIFGEDGIGGWFGKDPNDPSLRGTQHDPRAVGGRVPVEAMTEEEFKAFAAKQNTPTFRKGHDPVPLSGDEQASAERYLQKLGMLKKGAKISDLTEDERASAADFLKGKGLMAPYGVFNIHIHGADDPSDPAWQQKVRDVVDTAHSDTKAAITGGS